MHKTHILDSLKSEFYHFNSFSVVLEFSKLYNGKQVNCFWKVKWIPSSYLYLKKKWNNNLFPFSGVNKCLPFFKLMYDVRI